MANAAEIVDLTGVPPGIEGRLTPYLAEIIGFAPAVQPVLPVAVVQAPQSGGTVFNLPLQVGTWQNPNPYGVDILCTTDIDPYFSLVGGIQVLAQDLFHRLTCAPGSVPGAPTFGFDSRSLIGQGLNQTELQLIQSTMTSQLRADERVQSASVTLNYSNGALTITANVLPLNPQYSNQPFRFVASVSATGANLLSISPAVAS
jgi:hypothetical protein